ncbi:red chlorophyll catabolite reductase-like isoform X2 [Zingiber officinale]|uniref:red chlorophyll catabolite reductase-like isoform X2 n=1 Tax=Zingiber officinale TaxID=94328 RepID=UPI001C4D6B90|nr:red chlorophyll catabolite reductase-like isoform X2 [Zingiber officinale]
MSSLAVRCLLSPLLPRSGSAVAVASCKSRSIRVHASMNSPPPPVAEFPYLPPAQRDLMVEVLSIVETGLGPQLLPSTVPSDVLSYQNPSGSAHGALDIRYGGRDSTVDFILESWLHCQIPTGALNIATLFVSLNSSTDAPHLLMEFIQGSPTSLVLLLDLIPRKDVVLHPDYLDEFYHQTDLDKQRQVLAKLPQTMLEEIIRGKLNMICKEIVQIWLRLCVKTKLLSEVDQDILVKRDSLIKSKAIEIDLEVNLPRMFTPEIASRVVREIKEAYKVQDSGKKFV